MILNNQHPIKHAVRRLKNVRILKNKDLDTVERLHPALLFVHAPNIEGLEEVKMRVSPMR